MQEGRIGKYRIIAKLGQGGMATVFLSIASGPVGFNKLLVLKLLKDELESDGDFLTMFLNEARLAARLNHANVVQTYEVGVEQGRHFLAMDYLDGQPLHHLLRKVTRARMPLDVHVRILADMLAGLHYAHTLTDFDGSPLHVVHRDISPQNVFVTYDGQVKLVDFGIAKAAGAVSNTQSGVFKGKLTYVAPEQAGGDVVDARADIFSVGVMLWEAMSGRRFAQGEGQTETFAKRLAGTEPRIRDLVPDADPELADICDRAMAHRKEDRFATARDFRDALESFLDRFSRRVGSREVSDLMNAVFAEERDRIRAVIDQQMKQILRETAQALPVPTIEAHGAPLDHTPITTVEGLSRRRAPAEHHSGFPGAVETSSSGTLVGANVEPRPSVIPRSRTAALLLVGLAGLALLSVGTLVAVATLRSDGPASSASTSAPRTDLAAPTTAQGDKIQLTITFGPSSATAKLDGVPLMASPFTAQVPRDGSMHRIDVEGPGLAPKTMMVAFDKDLKLDIVLEAASASASTLATTTAPTQPQPGPGGRPAKPGGKQPLGIDEDDPYKKKQ
jgi:eukaryotic-like serine/threonine-protein kinase